MPSKYKFDNVKLFYFISFSASFSQGIFSMFAGLYLIDIGYSESISGNILSINTLAVAIGSIISAYLIERIGRKKSFYLSCILISVSMVLMVAFTNLPSIALFVVINGFGLSIRATAEGLFLAENTQPSNRLKAFSHNFVVTFFGFMTASFAGGHLSTFLSDTLMIENTIFYISLISSLFTMLFLFPVSYITENKPAKTRSLSECLKGYAIIKRPDIALYILYYSLTGIGAGMVVPFFSIYLKYSMSLKDASIGSILSFSQFGCIAGGLLLPYLTKNMGRHKTAIICQILSIPFLISIAFPQGIILVYISFFMRNGLMNMATPLNTSIFMDLVEPVERSNFSSLLSLFSSLSRAGGISMGGYIMEHFSYHTPYYFTTLLYISAIGVFIYASKKSNANKTKSGICA
ncbi:MFS transporter [Proteocatella sphenisci]|uniref:MFS transporter n=1 Tax=Proteocatella sphenisci TaxID=181070 RepID=UPI00048C4D58|nr:MFS transporter [Proteocatella sphenisci]